MTGTLHQMLDWEYGPDGDALLRERLAAGEDVGARAGPLDETPLHVAARRRRPAACAILLEHGADVDARNGAGKTAFAHAARRGFHDVTSVLVEHGASTDLAPADRFAIAVAEHRFDDARALLAEHPGLARTGNPEEDRLLGDLAGRDAAEPVRFLIEAGADLSAKSLDGGTALHVAAWFGQQRNARLLVEAGASLDGFDNDHASPPLHWAAHGSRYSGGAEARQGDYVAIVTLLLDAGASRRDPDDPDGEASWRRLLRDASPAVADALRAAGGPAC